MALSIALPLSGLEADHFTSVGAKDLYEQGLRTLNGISGPISPSTASESSGICSLVPSNESSTPDQTSDSSRPETPEEEEVYELIIRKQNIHENLHFFEHTVKRATQPLLSSNLDILCKYFYILDEFYVFLRL